MQDGGIQDDCIELKMDISQFRLNLEKVCVRFYGSINQMLTLLTLMAFSLSPRG